MDSKTAELLEKYWATETSLEEEKALRGLLKEGQEHEELEEVKALFDHFDVDDHPIINHQPTATATFHSGHFFHGGVFMAWGHTTLWGPTFQSRSLLVNLHDPRDSFRRKNQGFPCVPSDPLFFPHHHPKFYQTTRDK